MKKIWMKCISFMMAITLCVSLWSPVGVNEVSATKADVEIERNVMNIQAIDVGDDVTEDSNTGNDDSGQGDAEDGDTTEEKTEYSIVLMDVDSELIAIPELESNETYQLNPSLKNLSGEYVKDVEFTFCSSDDTVVSVTDDGLLETKALARQSTADITITCLNPDDAKETVQANYTVVVHAVPVTEVKVDNDTKTLIINDTYTINATILPAEALQDVKFESGNDDVATVSADGVVTAHQEGSVVITVISTADETKKTSVEIRVIDIPVSLELDKTAHSLKATDGFVLGAQLVYASGKKEAVEVGQLTFKSLDASIVTVDGQGNVTALEQTTYPVETSVQVIYEFDYEMDGVLITKQLSSECKVTVTAIPVDSIQLLNKETSITLEINDQYTLLPSVLPANATNPEVVYTTSKKSVATVDSNGVITAKSIGEATITVAAKENADVKTTFEVKVYQTTFNIAELGADGSDTKSDASAINKVLEYASHELLKEQMINVTVPDGTYYIDKILTIYSNTNLCLSDNAVIKRKESAGGKVMLRSKINSAIGGYEQCKNITITGGTWDGNANGSKDANCIYIGHAKNVVISDTTVMNNSGAHLIELAGVKNAVIENVELYGYTICKKKGYTASQADKEAIQLDYCSSSSTPAMKPHDLTPCENVTIRKCNIHDYMSGIGSHGYLPNVELKNISILDNKFTNITNSCINLMNFKNATIDGNKAYGFTTFLYASTSTGTVKNNTIKNQSFKKKTSSGLRAANGITVSNKSTFTIIKNKIQKATSNGITVWNGSTATIKNNKIKSNTLYGIRTQGSTITLQKNTISKNKKGLYDTYKDAKVKSSDDIRAYYIDIKAEYKYTGKKIKPKVKIKNLKKKYYKVSYKNNKKVGKATITIKGKGKVKGTLKKTFKIVKNEES